MMNELTSEWVKELVVDAAWDWVTSTTVLGVVQRSGIEDAGVLRCLWIGVAAEAMALGLLEPGSVDGAGFHPWGLPVSEALSRMLGELDRIGIVSLGLGDVAWFRATEEGARVAQLAIDSGWEAPD
jgi:hypothetical protein